MNAKRQALLRTLGRLPWSASLTITIVFGFILGACTAPEPTPVPANVPTPQPAVAATATIQAEVSYEQVALPETGLSLEVPASWQRLDPDWAWSPAGDGLPRLGVTWRDLQPPEEVEAALLPSPAQVLDSQPVDLGWGSGRRVTLEVYAPETGNGDAQAAVQSVETHVLVVVQEGTNRRAYDLFGIAESPEALSAIEPMLEHLSETATLERETTATTPAVAEPSLPAIEGLETALAANLVQDPEGLCEWAIWGQASQALYVWAVCEASSGSAASAPAVVQVSASGQVQSVQLPRDGSYYGADIRALFPLEIRQRILAHEFDAVAAMARIAERRASSKDADGDGTLAVTIYFGNSDLNLNIQDCSLVYPVVRLVSAVETAGDEPGIATVKAALEELLAGPTEAETEQGYVSMFSSQTASMLKNVRVEGATAYVNLADARQVIPSAGTSCGSQAFLAQVRRTVQGVLPVERVLYAMEGDPAAFYEWLQVGCSAANDFCDPAPFAEG